MPCSTDSNFITHGVQAFEIRMRHYGSSVTKLSQPAWFSIWMDAHGKKNATQYLTNKLAFNFVRIRDALCGIPVNHRALKFTIAKVSPLRRRENRERNVLPYNL